MIPGIKLIVALSEASGPQQCLKYPPITKETDWSF